MRKYEITWTIKDFSVVSASQSPLKTEEELIEFVNSTYGEQGWSLVTATQDGGLITLFFQREV